MKLNVKAVELEFDEKLNKLFADGVEVPRQIRKLGEMKDVIFNQTFINDKNKDEPLYYMFRAAGQDKNETIFEAHNMRYDVTVIRNFNLGGEFNKTFGHYHPICTGTLCYPELYEIISGEALYILQKPSDDGHFDVKLVSAKAGDKIIMEPNYGHISINVGKKPLVEVNLVNSKFQSDYAPIKQMHGGAVYVTDKRNVVINKNYKNVSISHMDAPKVDFLDPQKSIYDEYISHPEHFRFLNNPEFLLWKHDEWDLASQHF